MILFILFLAKILTFYQNYEFQVMKSELIFVYLQIKEKDFHEQY